MKQMLDAAKFGWLLGGGLLLAGPLAPLSAQATNGSCVRCWASMQVARASADEFVVYKREWLLNGTIPSPNGFVHLERIARRIQSTPFCVVVQPGSNVQVNEKRRQEVVQFLAAHGVADAVHRVVLAYPEAEGLAGDDAAWIFLQGVQSGNR